MKNLSNIKSTKIGKKPMQNPNIFINFYKEKSTGISSHAYFHKILIKDQTF